MPRPSDTRARILDLARTLLRAHGFQGFSYRHLAEALGVKTAAVHYHFRSKVDLGVELIIGLRRGFQRWAVEADSRFPGAADRLGAFFEMHGALSETGDGPPALGLQEVLVGSLPERMNREVVLLAAEVHGWLALTLRQGLASGELSFQGEPDDQALVVGATVTGALLLARALGPEKYRSAVAQLMRQLNAPPRK